jgi:hypothetical protein
MVRLTAPNGVIVNVSAERAKTLLTQGYAASGTTNAPVKKTVAKKATASKSK